MLLRVAYEGEGMGPLKLRWVQGGDVGALKLMLCVGRIEVEEGDKDGAKWCPRQVLLM